MERTIVEKVSDIYNNLFPTTISSRATDNFDSLTSNLKKITSDKNTEIAFLKEQETYRKEFIGNISHELKTPLFTIQGYVLTLLDGGVEDKKIRTKYLTQAAKGVDRLMYVIKDLDLITKFESGIETLYRTAFDLRLTLENVFELLEIEGVRNNITLRLDKKYKEPIIVFADEERIQQVLMNLIINSLKYGTERGVTEISFEKMNDTKLLIRINDNGDGISEEHLPRLFERFYRVDKTRNRNQGGSGLGLAIVKHIIEAHHERVFVESKVGIGSEFSFSLPLANKKEREKED
ncbi:ATP-binding protein [Flavobacteriaceae bacterium]|nr:ATP-binding protein [Flavobacteriaceae bacterium]MDA9157681.1 ATP-binding protein [Flavobacteriaceae bacterium]MDA9305214.1 ATP-binding protein [Flavobacteriaceae bacterium]MDA9810789.1 ATP-binding protein [Flavobacteriaceae bacterium]MDB4129145.1 ATP-binding protein [Flavobacteriaceae bacterium]